MYDIGYDDIGDLVGVEDLVGEDYEDYDDDEELAALLGAGGFSRFYRGSAPRMMTARTVRDHRARRNVQKAITQRAIDVAKAVKKVEQGTLLRKTEPTKSREFPIGFDSVNTIAAGAAATLTQRPQIVFRPERIVVPAAVAAFFQITDVKVGKNSQFVSAGAVPAATFAETAFGVRLKMDTCQISQDLIIDVTNIDVAARRFLASMIGESVE